MAQSLLSNKNLEEFITNLKISDGQKKFLLNELPTLDEKERLELLDTLKDIYALNQEETEALKKLKDNWE